MAREARYSLKIRECFVQPIVNSSKRYGMMTFEFFGVIAISSNLSFLIYFSLLLILMLKGDLNHNIWSHMTYVIT